MLDSHDANYYLTTYLLPVFIIFIEKSKVTLEQQLLMVRMVMNELNFIYNIPMFSPTGEDNEEYNFLITIGFGCKLQVWGKQFNGGQFNSGEVLSQTARTYSISFAKISEDTDNNNLLPPEGGNFCKLYSYYLSDYSIRNGKYSNISVIGSKRW